MNEALADLMSKLAVLAVSEMTTKIPSTFVANRKKKDINEICNSYEEVINKLMKERSELAAIAQALQNELNRYTISEDDIVHLQKTFSDVIDLFMPKANDDIKKVQSLISVDALKAIQLLGFDYKAAIGEPLTRACASAIEEKLQIKSEKKIKLSGSTRQKR